MFKNSKFFKFFKTLRFRLIVLLIAVAAIPCIVLGTVIVNTYEGRAVSIRESEVLSQAKILANSIATSSYIKNSGNNAEELQAQINMLTTIYAGRIIVVDKNFKIITDTYNLDDNKILISEEVIRCFKGYDDAPSYDSANRYIEMNIPIVDPDDEKGKILGVMVVSVSADNILLNRSYLTQIALIVALVVLAIVIFLGILSVIHMVRPLNRLSQGIEAISGGYGENTLSVDTYKETEEICDKFNNLFSNMRQMDESRQEFVSNVSHELKTPLTSMKVLADSLNSMPGASVELYQEFMEDITNEIERETKIINDLLSLVKMDKSAADMNISTVNMNELLEQILKRLQPIADKQQVELVLESFRPVTADVDEVKLTLAISNLIENGIKYNKNDGEGWVHVSLNADHQYMYLKVEDSGMGIPEDSLEQIFERFYRVDKSHSREIGGTGLGLAITRNSILMHRGAIKVHSVLEEGTTFDVRIPLKFVV